MPDSPLVTLTVWHPVGPVRADGVVMTDQGPGEDPAGGLWYYAGTSDVMDPQPSVWCDPTPAGEDALTIDDLRRVLRVASFANATHDYEGDAADYRSIVRLRRAIENQEARDGE